MAWRSLNQIYCYGREWNLSCDTKMRIWCGHNSAVTDGMGNDGSSRDETWVGVCCDFSSLSSWSFFQDVRVYLMSSHCPRKLWRPCRPEDPQRYLNCRSCKSIVCLNIRKQYKSHKFLPVQQDLQMLYLPVHPLFCQPVAEDLQILRRLSSLVQILDLLRPQ